MGSRKRKMQEEPASDEYNEHHDSRRCRGVGSCICDTVASIKEAQDEVDDNNGRDCNNRCVDSLLRPNSNNNNGLDTIPFVLQNKKGHYFSATGGIGTNDCFQTVFFRVERLDKDSCCATLSMLLPDCDLDFDKCCVDPMSLCDIEELERTRHCIEVDLDCFCSIQCLDPNLVGDIDHHHHRHHHHR